MEWLFFLTIVAGIFLVWDAQADLNKALAQKHEQQHNRGAAKGAVKEPE